MKFSFSKNFPFLRRGKKFFCPEPWVGLFSIQINQDVIFCPCYLKMRIGNLREKSPQEIWNAKSLVELRKSFRKGNLPPVCANQLCPVALDKEPH
jgi:MoaA/NifB/PqqE/SkfB family radical SAM enzyme